MDRLLQQVKDFAEKAHAEQVRKYTPDPYIVHPVRVMETCKRYSPGIPVLSAALLHDVLEDTAVTPGEMKDFLLTVMDREQTATTLALVIELTDVYTGSAYPKLNRAKRKLKEHDRMKKVSADAQTIKYADIMDNAKEIVGYDPAFAPVYLRECKTLLEKMIKGNKRLYEEALQTVQAEWKKLRNT